ncbi:unnamed protein product [Prorocentrum cordatum]|uniref:Deubiquitinating enzyme MINDY-3/4 conserved domain-containing protein n=1 Tax=Prorocentrum cordatum TaxID=2364126 RepID=A0ABN9RSK5_9DINO|nr:unnamed protein product [Polarella glacialis]
MRCPEDEAESLVRIKTRRGILEFQASQVRPRRLGVIVAKRRLILEYEVPGHLRALHVVDVPAADGPEAAAAARPDWAAEAEGLRRAHGPWLGKVATAQLARLLSHLAQLAPAPAEPGPPGRAAQGGHEAAEEAAQLAQASAEAGSPGRAPQGGHDASASTPRTIAAEEAQELRELACPYGLRQAEGGPCGVVAPVQGFLVRRLLMGAAAPATVTPEQRGAALLDALADVLCQCAPRCGAAGAPCVRVLAPPAGAAAGRVLRGPEGCLVHEFRGWAALRSALEGPPLSDLYLCDAEGSSASAGVLLFLYSVLSTRGASAVRADADLPDQASMIGAHGYCTQEAVNLLLAGRACSNVFDGDKEIGGEGTSDTMRLRGIESQTQVGFLSLFEAFGSLQVGTHMKSPAWPVWVVHAESHYSVLFSGPPVVGEQPERADQEVDVWYYDPLGRQDEEKRITVRPGRLAAPPDEDDLDANGMIAKVVRTRWGALADLDWNGADPSTNPSTNPHWCRARLPLEPALSGPRAAGPAWRPGSPRLECGPPASGCPCARFPARALAAASLGRRPLGLEPRAAIKASLVTSSPSDVLARAPPRGGGSENASMTC